MAILGKGVGTVAPEGRAQLYFFSIIGFFLAIYMFGNAISEQLGAAVDITMIMFLVLMAMVTWILGYLLSRLAKKTLTATDILVIAIAGASVIAVFIYFPGIVPSAFKGSVLQTQSFVASMFGG